MCEDIFSESWKNISSAIVNSFDFFSIFSIIYKILSDQFYSFRISCEN